MDEQVEEVESLSHSERWRRFAPAGSAFLGGLLIAASLPPWGWWPLAFVGLVLLERAIADAPAKARFRRAWWTGVGVLATSTIWMGAFTPPGYVIQVVAFSGYLGLTVALCPSNRWRWLALPGAYVIFEAVKGRFPFGGVPLSELAMGQVAGPLAGVARVGGVILLGLVTGLVAMALAAAVRKAWVPAAALAAVALLFVGLAQVAPRGAEVGQTIVVAYVQGGGEQGTVDAETDDREVFLVHYDATREFIEPGQVDLIMWPENVVNVDGPIEDQREGRELAALARELKAPVVAGVVEGAGPEHFTNAAVVFGVDGEVEARYDKVRRVPFGEFVPLRGLLEPIAGDTLPAKDAIIGEVQNTVDIVVLGQAGSGGTDDGDEITVRMGLVISWEVFFGDRGRDGVNGDGEPAGLLANPTNGSSYRGTLVQSQQIASSRLRAIESGRWVVQNAPTGFSAFVSDTGTVHQRSKVSETRVETRAIPLREGRTLYAVWGPWPPFLLAVGMVAAAHAIPRALARRDRQPAPA